MKNGGDLESLVRIILKYNAFGYESYFIWVFNYLFRLSGRIV